VSGTINSVAILANSTNLVRRDSGGVCAQIIIDQEESQEKEMCFVQLFMVGFTMIVLAQSQTAMRKAWYEEGQEG